MTDGAAGDRTHRAACVKHDAFDVDYEGSRPLEVDAGSGFTAGLEEEEESDE